MTGVRWPLPLPFRIALIGPLTTSGFTLASLAAACLGFVLAARRFHDEPPAVRRRLLWGLLWGALASLVAARLADQWTAPDLRFNDPRSWLPSLATGTGLAWAGGIVEGIVIFAAWLRSGGVPWRQALDRLAPVLAWAAAVGWLGVPYYGRLTQLPWGLRVAPGLALQPIQVYGFLGFGGLGWLLAWQEARLAYAGGNGVTLLALASAIRLLLGFALPGARAFGPWTATQLADAALLVGALLWGSSLAAAGAGPP